MALFQVWQSRSEIKLLPVFVLVYTQKKKKKKESASQLEAYRGQND